MIFDTTFIVDVMRNEAAAVAKLHELISKGEPQLVTAVTIFELFSGLARSKKPEQEKEGIRKVLYGQLIIHFDKEAAERAGDIDGTLIKEGTMIDPTDSMIAGIAVIKKEKLLTRNVKHFSRVRGLEIEVY